MQNKSVKLILVALLVVAIGVQGIFIVIGSRKTHNLEKTVTNLQSQQGTSNDGSVALGAVAMSQPAVSVTDKKVYFPDINLTIPLNKQATSLLYQGRTVGGDPARQMTTYDVTTRALASQSSTGYQTEIACTPVRLSFEATANPYNQHEKPSKAVKLADGRTLQVYTYSNQKCDAQWRAANVDPAAIAALFEQASSY